MRDASYNLAKEVGGPGYEYFIYNCKGLFYFPAFTSVNNKEYKGF